MVALSEPAAGASCSSDAPEMPTTGGEVNKSSRVPDRLQFAASNIHQRPACPMIASDGRLSPTRLRDEQGSTLIEALIASVLLVIVVIGATLLLISGLHLSATSRAHDGATNLARQITEDARTIPYGQIAPATIVAQLQAMNGLADAAPTAGWQVNRVGTTYTVNVSECSIDDPKDGYGVHDGTFCTDSSTTGSADPQPADLKRVTVDVAWTTGTVPHDVKLVQAVSSAGQAIGPVPSNLLLSSPTVTVGTQTAPVITNSATTTLTFTVTAPPATTAVNWTLNGNVQAPAPTVSGTSWTFSWPIPLSVSDGTYTVGVQAVDANGVQGPPLSMNVTLIRSVPAAPTAIVGGFNTVNSGGVATAAAELQWHANSELNVIGYRVYGPSGALACPSSSATLSLVTSCIDFGPPPYNAPNRTYSVYALYRDAQGAIQQGSAASYTIAPTPSPPNAPTGLTATAQPNGTVLLRWTAPSGGTPVAFYRIYEDGTNYANRYDFTGAATPTTYTDAQAFNSIHNYYVTAVSSTLAESAMLGPAHP